MPATPAPWSCRPCGEAALLVDLPDLAAVHRLAAALSDRPPAGLVEVVPGAATLLVRFDPGGTDHAAIEAAVAAVAAPAAGGGAGRRRAAGTREPGTAAREATVTVRVRYDGPDLTAVAELVGCSVEEVVAAHTGTAWQVGFGGFAPGFCYLVGGDPRLEVPRLETPRTRVPAGAVGLAGRFSGVYPRPSPGGWRIIGSTDVTLWDPDRDPPALLRPGMTVAFEAVSSG